MKSAQIPYVLHKAEVEALWVGVKELRKCALYAGKDTLIYRRAILGTAALHKLARAAGVELKPFPR